ncbi:hypothetical protein [Moorena sp. SIO3I6]|uniref:hypothetical protein n=1 Tax=Moorena sp. SIO3I6 TaxID=2607831 RepID=UPI0013FB4DDF|nr:hypothetical protein [Moorena sp. SIO3I6]NEP26635.1 hypothetical protein [Moorena sp. SIO3I6]
MLVGSLESQISNWLPLTTLHPDSRFPIPDSRFPIPHSRLPTPDSLEPSTSPN